MRKKYYLITAILLLIPVFASAQNKKDLEKRVEELEKLNLELIERINRLQDSLNVLNYVPKEVLANAQNQMNKEKEKLNAHRDDVEEGSTTTTTIGAVTPTKTDSLLSVWYIHNQMRNSNEAVGMGELGDAHFTTSVSDSVLIERLNKMNTFIKLPYNETVKNWMVLYSEKMPYRMSQMLGLSKFYMPIFEETFRKYNLPLELKYLCIIESAMNPIAVSRAGAAGMWQFMYSTARHYGLEVDSYIDERLDPFKEVDAAARLLRDNYEIFNDWSLAISAYNCGPGNVNKAIHRAGGSTDFWTIYDYLPGETRGYVPALVGAIYAFHYAKEYGIEPADVQMPAHVDTFHINKNMHLAQVSEVLGIPLEEVRSLNHQYYRDIIPGNNGTQILRLPYTYSAQFAAKQQEIYAYKADQYLGQGGGVVRPNTTTTTTTTTTASTSTAGQGGRTGNTTRYTAPQKTWHPVYHKVKSGENLTKIARRYGTTVKQIKTWNGLRSDTIQAGRTLIVGYQYW